MPVDLAINVPFETAVSRIEEIAAKMDIHISLSKVHPNMYGAVYIGPSRQQVRIGSLVALIDGDSRNTYYTHISTLLSDPHCSGGYRHAERHP